MEEFGEIIELQTKVRHAIHIVPSFWVGILFIDAYLSIFINFGVLILLRLPWEELCNKYLITPMAMNLIMQN